MSRTRLSMSAALFLALAACSGSNGSDANTESTAAARYDGVTLFNGAFFGRGAAARHFPEIWESPQFADALEAQRSSPEVNAALDKIIARMQSNDALVFERFQSAVATGDRVSIDSSLDDLGLALRTAVYDEFPAAVDAVPPGRDGIAINENVAVNQNLMINMNAALNVNVAVNVEYYKTVTHAVPASVTAKGTIPRSLVVDLLARRFKA